ncbi:MAG: dienelactone hydrolase family protein [Chloracidobacterium sp.]|nr:dienelactone hydrolase family protein [Chloracidobacterium sp.]
MNTFSYKEIFRASLILCLVFCSSVLVSAQGDSLSQPGRHKAGYRSVTVTRSNATTFTARLYYPATTSGQNTTYDGSGAPYPAITFGHGFFQAVSTYQSTLEHLATHGYFVIASNSESGLFPSHQNFANDLRTCLDYLTLENSSSTSALFNQVAINRFGASGHSMGGGASILAASQDTRIKALANLAAAETNPSATAAMPAIAAPLMLISGGADTIVPVSSNGQLMYNAAGTAKILPIIQGGWHCGFQDANGFGCDSGTIPREHQLRESRRLLTAFFNLYLVRTEINWKQVWGSELQNSLVSSQSNSGIEMSPTSQTVAVLNGAETAFSISITNRGSVPESYLILVDQQRVWDLDINPEQTILLQPNQSKTITFVPRRLRYSPQLNTMLLISTRKVSDGLTRSFVNVTLQQVTPETAKRYSDENCVKRQTASQILLRNRGSKCYDK